jgi:hypothetical protein
LFSVIDYRLFKSEICIVKTITTKSLSMKKFRYFLLLTGIVAMVACSKGSDDDVNGTPPPQNPPPQQNDCNGVNAKFAADIDPIIQTKCSFAPGCHGNGSGNGPGELLSFTQIKNAASSIKAAVNAGRMPKGGTLTSAQLKSINCWVNGNASNN